jgi:N-acyl-D-aspartate/D-glutamate deacylase
VPALREALEQGLREGALGIGVMPEQTPGADRREIFRVFQFASDNTVPVFMHVRANGIDAMQEAIADAAATGASLHIEHVNSKSLNQLPLALELISSCQHRGLDITTEAYPYPAGSAFIQSAVFDDGWRERQSADYQDLQWQATRERLTADSFERYRAQGGVVIIHNMKEEMIELAMRTPFVMIASDGMPYAPGVHPRSAGSFSRVLGRYVRERGVLSLMQALPPCQ